MSRAYSTLSVDLNAYEQNLRYVRELLPDDCRIAAVIKADGYGLGALQLAQRALVVGVDLIAVATVNEAVTIRREIPNVPVIALLQPPRSAIADVLEHDIKVVLSDLGFADALGAAARSAKKLVGVHCEIDTGMGRQGFSSETATDDLQQITRISNLDIEGIFTHFPNAEVVDDAFTNNQLKVFRNLLREIDHQGIPYDVAHMANSAGIINYPSSMYSMVRPGLMTFGIWPTDNKPAESPLKPVVRWTSSITLVKKLSGGTSVGYGRTHKVSAPTTVAVVPVGYADGYLHSLSNQNEVLVRGLRCPVIGRVSMDCIVVDITKVSDVSAGDTVTLIGGDGREFIGVEDLAARADTIPYEILTRIGPRVHREYLT